jgi:hypothetical protein
MAVEYSFGHKQDPRDGELALVWVFGTTLLAHKNSHIVAVFVFNVFLISSEYADQYGK